MINIKYYKLIQINIICNRQISIYEHIFVFLNECTFLNIKNIQKLFL